tara:strand:+ start:34 stop:1041 length:1008 start_codon:yes stop_codon:yes gene_type:complete
MSATILLGLKEHHPVLLREIISIISPQNGGTYVDCTFGQGGYSSKILNFPNTKVYAFDRDPNVLNYASILKKKYQDRFYFKNKRFSQIKVNDLNKETVDAFIFDLGLSSTQISNHKSGISFSSKGKLNMQMGINDFSANEVVNHLEKKDLEKIFYYFGEEKLSRIIANKIVIERKKKNLLTEDLVRIIESTKKFKKGKHKATKIFQSIRMFVNKEISELLFGLINSFQILKPGGKIVVVTFHSIEDKIVKYFFKKFSENNKYSRYLPEIKDEKKLFILKNKKPIYPSVIEIKRNPSSRSAKLRYAEKCSNNNFIKDDLIKKFENLIKIENISKKL